MVYQVLTLELASYNYITWYYQVINMGYQFINMGCQIIKMYYQAINFEGTPQHLVSHTASITTSI